MDENNRVEWEIPPPDDGKPSRQACMQALSVFCTRYDPADDKTATDFFSTAEIQKIVGEHIGIEVEKSLIYELLVEMKYTYKMMDDEFVWLCKT